MLDQDFCEFLEYEITKALSSSTDERLKGFWCDGVLLPHSGNEYLKKTVDDNRQVVMTAFTGQSGQDKYELTLRFGRKALSRYARDFRLEECVPNPKEDKWLDITQQIREWCYNLTESTCSQQQFCKSWADELNLNCKSLFRFCA